MLKKSILIIDEDTLIQEPLTRRLEEVGYNVLHAYDGMSGYASALKYKPDGIVLDIRMPALDGISLLERLRKDEGYGSTAPVLILSNIDPSEIDALVKVDALRPAYYLLKVSSSIEEVVGKIREMVPIV